MWEDRTSTMIYDELPFNAEATRSPHASRCWSLVAGAAVGPLVHHLCRNKVPSRGTGRAAAQGTKAPTPKSLCTKDLHAVGASRGSARAHRADCTLRPAQAHT